MKRGCREFLCWFRLSKFGEGGIYSLVEEGKTRREGSWVTLFILGPLSGQRDAYLRRPRHYSHSSKRHTERERERQATTYFQNFRVSIGAGRGEQYWPAFGPLGPVSPESILTNLHPRAKDAFKTTESVVMRILANRLSGRTLPLLDPKADLDAIGSRSASLHVRIHR